MSISGPSSDVVETILSGNNNFVSTLDHLPCDITRSLWIIQSLNLENERLKEKVESAPDAASAVNMERKLSRNNEEIVAEAKYLIEIVSHHLDVLDDDRAIVALLKERLPSWTSEAVEENWGHWTSFKEQYLRRERVPSVFEEAYPSREGGKRNGASKEKEQPKKIILTLKKKPVKVVKPEKVVKPDNVEKLKIILKHESHNGKTTQPNGNIVYPQVEKQPTTSSPPLLYSSPPKEERYCFCNGPSFGRMVACEYSKCPHEWFHFKCVGLTSEPKGEWFCSLSCKEKHQLSKQRKKKRMRNW